MITRKRINNDIFIRWAIFKPDNTPEDFSNATIQYVRAKAKGDGSIYDLTYEIDGHILDVQFPANKQKDIGLHTLTLEYTKPDATVEGGVATYTIDYCNAFDLVPVTCALLSPQEDPIVIQGIIAAFSYSMLTNEEKNDLANRLSQGAPYLRLRTNTYIIHEDKEGNHSPNVVEVHADTTNTNVSEWKVGINGGALQVVEEGNSPFAEVVLDSGVIKISTSGIVRDRYEVRATDGTRADSLVINKLSDGEDGKAGDTGTPGVATTTAFVYRVDYNTPSTPTDNFVPPTGWSVNITPPGANQRIYLSTRRIVNNQLVGEWSDPVPISGIDGQPGEDGVDIEFIYQLTKIEAEKPDKPIGAQADDDIPEGWSDNPSSISEEWQFEWFCVRKKENGIWSEWSEPTIWARWGVKGMDGDSVEYIFRITELEEAPDTPPSSDIDDSIPEGWSDDPVGVDIFWPYEWVCIRKKHDGIWGAYSEPALWAKYGKDGDPGEDGISSFKSIVFIRSDDTPSIPTGGDWESPKPTSTPEWSDGIPVGTAPLYMSTRVFTNTGQPPQQSNWTTPRLASDTPDIDFEYSEVISNPGTPTTNPDNWNNTPTPNSIWMAIRKKTSGTWGAWQVFKIKGEDGKDGDDGKEGMGNQMIYKRTTEEVAPTDLTNSQDDNHLPTYWTRKPTGVTNNWKYEWVSVRHKVEGVWDNFSTPPALFAKYSEDGAPGQQGLDGPVVRVTEWQTGQAYENQENLITDEIRWIDVVIVRRSDGDFDVYKCIASHNSSAVNKPGSGGSWTEYWEAFQTMPPIYTPMIMADNAIIRFNQSNQLVVTNAAGIVQAGITGGNDGDILIWSGGTLPSNATFKVYRNGTIEGTGFELRADGSGFIANQNISWTPSGSATYKGALESNASGDKIVIDTSSGKGRFRGIDSSGNLMIELGFTDIGDSVWKNSAMMRLFARRYNSDEDPMMMSYYYGSIDMSVGVMTDDLSRAQYGIESFNIERFSSGSRVARFNVSTYGTFNNPNMLLFELEGLPTSDANIPTGTVWRDGNILKIK